MLKNLKLSGKLILGLGIMVAASATMMLTAIINLYNIGGLVNKLYQSPFTVSTQSIMLQKEIQNMGREIRGMVLYEDPSYLDSVLTSSKRAKANLALVEKWFLGDQQLILDMYQNLDEIEAMGEEINQLVAGGKIEEAKRSADIDFRPVMKSGIEISQEIVDTALNKALEFNEDAGATLENATMMLIVLLVVMVVLCMGITTALSRAICSPISQITEAAKKLAAGILNTEITYYSKDEVGILAESFREMSSSMNAVIKDIDQQLGAMSHGDFTVTPQAEYTGDYISIKNALINIEKSLSNTINEINLSADQVFSSSAQVSDTAQTLSQGAAQQAGSIEELAASINEISFQVRKTAANTEAARHLTSKAGQQVEVSNLQMEEMLLAMGEISEKTEQIRAINNTVEEIAFQTNILALNAAVEAARTGEDGKGFAIVADEIRRLAGKSKEAAKHTLPLIDVTVQVVEKGRKIADTTAKSLHDVVESTNEVLNTVDNIDAAAQYQADFIAQVTQGIDQISEVVQNNTAVSEESAAASEELSGQARMLKELVSRFKIGGSQTANHPEEGIEGSSGKLGIK
ncbi:HAMP domain-containing protein [Clostridium sp. MCC353]|uniref:methyl-accepting chemotaxis protein n=1 Tax=Clostridium sp. MCC353 TaxID=2592646 RepID=UPI001C01AEAF|nr:methyl-accepting chemotaxis protein [Clostridium sp. MCC353]MBT9776606.1 HAMP domain-containing protein [Clostridium sp. MCC353]